jgi:hypothetical protein
VTVARLIYSTIESLDGYVANVDGRFDSTSAASATAWFTSGTTP